MRRATSTTAPDEVPVLTAVRFDEHQLQTAQAA